MLQSIISLKHISQCKMNMINDMPLLWKGYYAMEIMGLWNLCVFFSYTYDVIGDFSLTSASIDVIRLAVSNFNWGDLVCFQGSLCTSDVMGVSSVMLVSFNVVGLSVSKFSWGYPICSQGLFCTPAANCSSICLLRR